MTAYQTVVVGTDGSESSLRAVERAGEIAAESNAKLIIATGYSPPKEDPRAADVLREESYLVSGAAPIYEMLRDARDRAKAAGPKTSRTGRFKMLRSRRSWTWPRRSGPICWWSAMWGSTRDRRSSDGCSRSPGLWPVRPRSMC